jgi:hypothetical protein
MTAQCSSESSFPEAWASNNGAQVGGFQGLRVHYFAEAEGTFVEGRYVAVFSYESETRRGPWTRDLPSLEQAQVLLFAVSDCGACPLDSWYRRNGERHSSQSAHRAMEALAAVDGLRAVPGLPYVILRGVRGGAEVAMLDRDRHEIIVVRHEH